MNASGSEFSKDMGFTTRQAARRMLELEGSRPIYLIWYNRTRDAKTGSAVALGDRQSDVSQYELGLDIVAMLWYLGSLPSSGTA
jgi:hypothetical protein